MIWPIGRLMFRLAIWRTALTKAVTLKSRPEICSWQFSTSARRGILLQFYRTVNFSTGWFCRTALANGARGLCCTNRRVSEFPLPRSDLSHALRDRASERRVAVQDRGADLKLDDLAVEVA